jgi:DNA-binding response OmpR family regulator
MAKILIIDDEANIIELARLYLERAGFTVVAADNANQGLATYASAKPDLVVLDVMLPDIDGFEVCRRLRASGNPPILILSARREDMDRIVGLELGADDYLTKPFNPHELVARVKAILRRSQQPPPSSSEAITLGGLRIDLDRYEVEVEGRPIKLRSKEFALLAVFAKNPGVVLSRERLLDQVWGYDYYGDTRTVDVHVNHLRAKLEGTGVEIETLRGTGYKMVAGEKRV